MASIDKSLGSATKMRPMELALFIEECVVGS